VENADAVAAGEVLSHVDRTGHVVVQDHDVLVRKHLSRGCRGQSDRSRQNQQREQTSEHEEPPVQDRSITGARCHTADISVRSRTGPEGTGSICKEHLTTRPAYLTTRSRASGGRTSEPENSSVTMISTEALPPSPWQPIAA